MTADTATLGLPYASTLVASWLKSLPPAVIPRETLRASHQNEASQAEPLRKTDFAASSETDDQHDKDQFDANHVYAMLLATPMTPGAWNSNTRLSAGGMTTKTAQRIWRFTGVDQRFPKGHRMFLHTGNEFGERSVWLVAAGVGGRSVLSAWPGW